MERTLFEAKVRTIDLENTVAKAMEQVMMLICDYDDDDDGGNDGDDVDDDGDDDGDDHGDDHD